MSSDDDRLSGPERGRLASALRSIDSLLTPDGYDRGWFHLDNIVPAVERIVADRVARARAEGAAEALRDMAQRVSGELGSEKNGHTSTYSVRRWLNDEADHRLHDSEEQ